MSVKFSNNATTQLSAGISSGVTSFTVSSASGFPTLGGSDWTYVTIDSEVVKVTAISGTTFTCDTTSEAHLINANVELRMTAELLNDFAEDVDAYTHPTTDGYLHVPATSTNNNGKYLKAGSTAGSLSWDDVDALPSQSGENGKYLTTNGSSASWAVLDTDANTTTKGLYEHEHTIDADYSISSGSNALSASPITISSGYSVTIPSGSTWVIV